jgi:hypothetical protein
MLDSLGTLIAGTTSDICGMNFIFRVLMKIIVPGNRFSIIPTGLVLLVNSPLTSCFADRNITIINTDHKIILSNVFQAHLLLAGSARDLLKISGVRYSSS